jgi:hypothetical protein
MVNNNFEIYAVQSDRAATAVASPEDRGPTFGTDSRTIEVENHTILIGY